MYNGLIIGLANWSVGPNVLALSHASIPIKINIAAAAANNVILRI